MTKKMKMLNKYQHVTYFEDDGKMYVVVKAYGKNREWWHYEVWEAEEWGDYKEERNEMDASIPRLTKSTDTGNYKIDLSRLIKKRRRLWQRK